MKKHQSQFLFLLVILTLCQMQEDLLQDLLIGALQPQKCQKACLSATKWQTEFVDQLLVICLVECEKMACSSPFVAQTDLPAQAETASGGFLCPYPFLGYPPLFSQRYQQNGFITIKLQRHLYCSTSGVVLSNPLTPETERTNDVWCFTKCLQWFSLANVWGFANGNTSWL